MIFKANYPVLIPACRPPGFKNSKPAIIYRNTEVAIETLGLADVPVVLEGTSSCEAGVEHFQYRYHNGRFLKMFAGNLDNLQGYLDNPITMVGGLAGLMRDIVKDLKNHAAVTLPPGIVDVVDGREPIHFNQEIFLRRSLKTVIDPEYESLLEPARLRHEQACSSFVLIDGQLWIHCKEPLLAVDMSDGPNVGRISVVDKPLIYNATNGIRGTPESHVQLFSMSELETAKELSSFADYPTAARPDIDLQIDHGAFLNDFPYLDDAKRILYDLFIRGRLAGKADDIVWELMRGDANGESSPDEDGMEAIITACLVVSTDEKSVADMESALERLRGRTISIVPDGSMKLPTHHSR